MNDNFYDKHYYKKQESFSRGGKVSLAKAREIDFLKRIIYLAKKEKVLDLGCGTGDYLKAIEGRGADLWGIDISENATAVAKNNLSKPEQIICGDVCPLPFSDDSFDCLTAWGVIEHFPDIPKIIADIARVVKEDGTVVIMVPNCYYYKFIWDVLRQGKAPAKHQEIETLYSFGEWKKLLEKSGLKIVKIFRHNKFNKSKIVIWFRNKTIPFYFSNHFVFLCKNNKEKKET